MKILIKGYHDFLKERFKGDKPTFIVELLYVLFCLGSGVYFAVLGRVQNTVMAFCFPVVVLLICLIEWKGGLRGGAVFYIVFFLMCSSNILGNGYGLYALMHPYFDKIMHTVSGIAFTCAGYAFTKKIAGGDDGKKFIYCLVFGLMFAMAIASVWEVFEYFVSEVLHDDMQSNYTVYTLDYVKYISNTTIYFTDGTMMEVEGYIDVGLFDTLQDITVCLCGSLFTIALLVLDHFCFKKAVNRLLIPRVIEGDSGKYITEKCSQLAENKKTD